ncbi:unnamed protein product [Oppiella nova]|uniref:Methyltransferase type 12 domain-containing protein n=1 Tax=Oppiella nova TaxID=334625 RepID=A0A7R9MJ13_9ACAR|nr:unnamed protein product [Oppiella nova]CAG2178257.1 unnamed protein product [Oppiella nova]
MSLSSSADTDHQTTADDVNVRYGHQCRQLSAEEVARLESHSSVVSEFRQNRLEREAKKNWDLFYKRNTNKFFKDRHWTQREFEELMACEGSAQEDRDMSLLEVGCGVGNTVWPLIAQKTNFRFYVCDFSPVAIDLFRQNPLFDDKKCTTFVTDVTEEDAIRRHLGSDVHLDYVSLIFVLSAINPKKMRTALNNIHQVFKAIIYGFY